MWKRNASIVKYTIYIGIIMALTMPFLILTLYSYPVQDDFHYAYYGHEMMKQGHNLISMSFIKTGEYYRTFAGCYTSTFLGYFFSAIINCDIWGIRIFELLSAIVFYFALYAMLRMAVIRVMGYEKEKVMPIYILLLLCFNGLIHYEEQEDFFWFITSVQYLLITSFIFFGIALFLHALDTENKKTAVAAAVLGFLGSGGALNIAALCCVLYLLAAFWGFFVKKKRKMSGLVFGVALVGALINALAPGNFIRAGEPLTIGKLVKALTDSFAYLLLRMKILIKNPIYIAIVIILVMYLLLCKSRKSNCGFHVPVIFMGILFSFVAIIIFPVMLGYGWDVYLIICRSNFISDAVIYLFTFLTLFYFRGWLEWRFPGFELSYRFENFMLIFSAAVLAIMLWRRDWSEVPFLRYAREWHHGVYREWSDYCMGVYRQIEEAEGNTPEIVIQKVQDTTCMISPKFWIGWYDMEKEHANRSIAQFYGKDAVYIFYEE